MFSVGGHRRPVKTGCPPTPFYRIRKPLPEEYRNTTCQVCFKSGKISWRETLYLFLLPAFLLLIVFRYVPIYGIQLAFKDFVPAKGITGSPWVGLRHFRRFFRAYQSWDLIRNTLVLNLYQLVAGFPLPIILALLLNHMGGVTYRKLVQTSTYLPHFISVVVVVGMMYIFLSPRVGVYGHIMRMMSLEPQNPMGSARLFKTLYVVTEIWQHAGWDSIIYIAALSGVNQSLYEAAVVDGATTVKKIIHIDLPSILPTIMIIFILRTGHMMDIGFEKVYLMQNDLNIGSSEVISTYVYKVGLLAAQFSFSTAVGLFRNIINFVLLITVNRVSRYVSQYSLW